MREGMFGDNLEVEGDDDCPRSTGHVSVYLDTSGSVWLTPREAEVLADRLQERAYEVRETVES